MVAAKRKGTVRGKGAAVRRQADSWCAHRCIVLAVDTAECSGWAIMVEGALYESGEVNCLDNPDGVYDVVQKADSIASCEGIPVVLVLEAPFAGNKQGQYRGAWRMCAAKLGCRLVVQVNPATWRSRVLGFGLASAERSVIRRAEQTRAHHDVMRTQGRRPGPDEAAAVCIGYWATYAHEVRAKLQRARKGAV